MKMVLNPKISRMFPDPVPGIKHYILLIRANDLPTDIPLDPNPREQNINRVIYKDVQESLENTDDPTFHLKNKGITMVASSVKGEKSHLTITMNDGDGIMDGGHTYRIIQDSKKNNTCPAKQYVKIEVITGLNRDEVLDIAGGLNTAVQVQKASLMNLEGRFDWIKDILVTKSYGNKIAYKQNERNEFNIREVVSIMSAFVADNPIISYTSKGACLEHYVANEEKYKRLETILPDILYLYDFISLQAREQYNKAKKDQGASGRAGGMIGLFEKKAKGEFAFHFAEEKAPYRLHKGILYPMLSAMKRILKEQNGQYSWNFDSFEGAKDFFKQVASEMVEVTQQISIDKGRNPNAVGKDHNHWKSLGNIVDLAHKNQMIADLQKQIKANKHS